MAETHAERNDPEGGEVQALEKIQNKEALKEKKEREREEGRAPTINGASAETMEMVFVPRCLQDKSVWPRHQDSTDARCATHQDPSKDCPKKDQ